MRYVIIFSTLFCLIQFNQIKSEDYIKGQILYVHVNGLVCDFCARSIEKMFSKKESVSNVDLSLEKILITINFKEGKNLNDEKIIQIIEDAGYAVTEIRRVK